MGTFTISIFLVFLLTTAVLYFIFKKRNPDSTPLRSLKFWASTMVLSPIIYMSTIWIWFSIGVSYEDKAFNQTEWKEDQHSRYQFTKDIVESDILKNLSPFEVVDLLGQPSEKNDSIYIFNTGYNPKIFMNGRPDFLEIVFENGVVKKSFVHR